MPTILVEFVDEVVQPEDVGIRSVLLPVRAMWTCAVYMDNIAGGPNTTQTYLVASLISLYTSY